jgi:hypothetical protein
MAREREQGSSFTSKFKALDMFPKIPEEFLQGKALIRTINELEVVRIFWRRRRRLLFLLSS